MRGDFRYILEPYGQARRKYLCPECGKKTFTRYWDSVENCHIDSSVGRCDREVNCGYHYKPKDYFLDRGRDYTPGRGKEFRAEPEKPVSTVPERFLKASQAHFDINPLIQFLPFNEAETRAAIEKYNIGTSKHWGGSTVFWYLDMYRRIRGGKLMKYDPETGHRVKEGGAKITWTHCVMDLKGFNFRGCLFGEHLLGEHMSKPVAVVESEKTAIVADKFFPDYLWIATGSVSIISPTWFKPLKDRDIVLFPDCGAYDKWLDKTSGLIKAGFTVTVSDFLENHTTAEEHGAGYDLADYFLEKNDGGVLTMTTTASEGSVSISTPDAGFADKGLATPESVRSSNAIGGENPPSMVNVGPDQIKAIARRAERYGSEHYAADKKRLIGQYFKSKNPSYMQLIECFGLEYGEPVTLEECPF